MKISIITHYYLPEIGAPQARLSEMASEWQKNGHDVLVVTCFPNHPTGTIHPDYQAVFKKKRYMEERLNDISVVRCWVYATPNKGFAKKILGHISFMFSSIFQAWQKVKETDIIIASSPTFFSVFSAWFFSKLFKKPYIFEVRDLWPAIFIDLGVLKNSIIIHLLEKLELFLYKQAAAVVPVTNAFAENIVQRGVQREKVSVITNGANLELFKPIAKAYDLKKQIGVEDKFVVLYIGAHGISHALTKIVDAADALQKETSIQFLFVGEGAEKANLIAYANKLKLSNITFLPGQPKDKVPNFYSIADIGLVPLRNIPLFETFIPSKMFELMAMEIPIVASVSGEAREILQRSMGALVGDPEDVSAIIYNILKLVNDKILLEQLGKHGRKFVVENYNRVVLAEKYLKVIEKCISQT